MDYKQTQTKEYKQAHSTFQLITHECGHKQGYYTLPSDEGERLKCVQSLQSDICPYCHLGACGESWDRVAINRSSLAGLPPLQGTIKQLKWAAQIRYQFYKTLSDQLNQDEIIPAMSRHLDAKFWIDNREASDILKHL
ncbi:hypothetical protein [Geotalea sp. SG265]|uniref:hypothetical protein n=1 Tax=Geotalea sp. SG265 TaxID=2922867 RepID=UPI001FAF47BE|nr:hypothetical protein [Geotalea sp. SG265]